MLPASQQCSLHFHSLPLLDRLLQEGKKTVFFRDSFRSRETEGGKKILRVGNSQTGANFRRQKKGRNFCRRHQPCHYSLRCDCGHVIVMMMMMGRFYIREGEREGGTVPSQSTRDGWRRKRIIWDAVDSDVL